MTMKTVETVEKREQKTAKIEEYIAMHDNKYSFQYVRVFRLRLCGEQNPETDGAKWFYFNGCI